MQTPIDATDLCVTIATHSPLEVPMKCRCMVSTEHSGRFIRGKIFFIAARASGICPAAKIREIICTISCLAACSHPVFAAVNDDEDLDFKKKNTKKKVWTDKREKKTSDREGGRKVFCTVRLLGAPSLCRPPEALHSKHPASK